MDDTHILIRAAKSASLDLMSYSGRGMYGARCVGIDAGRKNEGEIIAALIRGCRDMSRDESDLNMLLDHIEETETDSLGMGIVMYWPNIEAPEDAEAGEDNGE